MTETLLSAGAVLSLIVWLGLALLRAGFWRSDQRLQDGPEPDRWPAVAAVIPARNEAATIGRTVASLLAQNYPGQLEVIVVDDNSEDGTSDAARLGARVHLIDGKPLATGWSGKLWAVHQGIEAIPGTVPDAEYVLFTDADIEHHPDNLRQLVSKAVHDNRHLVSLMVALRCESFWEKLLIPAFVFFFQKLYPFPQVNTPGHPMAAAAGGCMLVRLQTLLAAGGIEPIRDRLIDDCAMAALIKKQAPIWLGLSTQTRSLRAYAALGDIWHMVARTAFVQLDHSVLNLAGTLFAMVIVYVLPPLLFACGLVEQNPLLWGTAGGAYLVMVGLYAPTLRLYRLSVLRGFALPLAAAFYSLMTLSSALRHWRGRGGNWKGRSYPKSG